ELVKLDIPRLIQSGLEIEAEVVLVDGFGNVITNLSRATFDAWRGDLRVKDIFVHLGAGMKAQIHRTYGDVAPGLAVAYFGSSGRLEIGVRNGSAVKDLGLARGSRITLHKKS